MGDFKPLQDPAVGLAPSPPCQVAPPLSSSRRITFSDKVRPIPDVPRQSEVVRTSSFRSAPFPKMRFGSRTLKDPVWS